MKIKEMWNKAVGKVKAFVNENGELVLLIGVGLVGAAIGGCIAYDAGRDDGWKAGHKAAGKDFDTLKQQNENYRKTVVDLLAVNSDLLSKNDISDEEEDEGLDDWDDQDTANWESICELASKLELKAGESYMIGYGNDKDSDSGLGIGDNTVFHYRWGDECYPADAEWYTDNYAKDDDEEEEEEDEQTAPTPVMVVVNDPSDKEARDLVVDFCGLHADGRITLKDYEG